MGGIVIPLMNEILYLPFPEVPPLVQWLTELTKINLLTFLSLIQKSMAFSSLSSLLVAGQKLSMFSLTLRAFSQARPSHHMAACRLWLSTRQPKLKGKAFSPPLPRTPLLRGCWDLQPISSVSCFPSNSNKIVLDLPTESVFKFLYYPK